MAGGVVLALLDGARAHQSSTVTTVVDLLEHAGEAGDLVEDDALPLVRPRRPRWRAKLLGLGPTPGSAGDIGGIYSMEVVVERLRGTGLSVGHGNIEAVRARLEREGITLARSDLLKKLFHAYNRGADSDFRAAAHEIIADERRKRHSLLAGELEHALHRDIRPGARTPLTLKPLPKDRDERPLVQLLKPAKSLDDLIFPPDVRAELDELAEENRHRHVLVAHDLLPRQVLLFHGPPGTGKTAAAHAIADYLSLPVAAASLAALSSSYLGETAKNIEAVMRFAEQVPCVLLLDEFDAVAAERGGRSDHGEIRRLTAAVLQFFERRDTESILIATSNHPTLLDDAIWRRFDDVIRFDGLTADDVARLIRQTIPAAASLISVDHWAEQMAQWAPADIEAACRHALRTTIIQSQPLGDGVFAAAVSKVHNRRSMATRPVL